MKFIYEKIDENKRREILLQRDLHKIFNMLMMRLGGDPKKSLDMMKQLKERGYLSKETDLDQFYQSLKQSGMIKTNDNSSRRDALTQKGSFAMREYAFREIFSKMKKGGGGSHSLYETGRDFQSKEVGVEKRGFEFGDDFSSMDMNSSFFNSIRRNGELDFDLQEQDIEVFESDLNTSVAIVLMIDISHSMILYGEDRITPAKELAMALAHIVTTQHPRDALSIVLFGDDAVEVEISDLPHVSVGPFHTNTQMGLRKAREILVRKKQANKQIIMITDGKPSMIKLSDGNYYKNAFGLDPEIVSRTLDEAMLCRRRNIPITTFMITQDEVLKEFVKQLSAVNKGKTFYCDIDNLGSFVVENFLNNRKNFFR